MGISLCFQDVGGWGLSLLGQWIYRPETVLLLFRHIHHIVSYKTYISTTFVRVHERCRTTVDDIEQQLEHAPPDDVKQQLTVRRR